MRKIYIRFTRRGRYKRPFYDIIVVYKDRPPVTKCIEKIGIFDPDPSSKRILIDTERLAIWLNKGARLNFKVKKIISEMYYAKFGSK